MTAIAGAYGTETGSPTTANQPKGYLSSDLPIGLASVVAFGLGVQLDRCLLRSAVADPGPVRSQLPTKLFVAICSQAARYALLVTDNSLRPGPCVCRCRDHRTAASTGY